MVEVIISSVLLLIAVSFLVFGTKKTKKVGCGCDSCSCNSNITINK